MKEKILILPTPYGENLELYKNVWGKSGESLSIVSGLQGDHLNGLFVNSKLTQFLDRVIEGLDPHYTLTGQVQTFPVVNINAVQSGTRLWPLDGMDMDLAFPGNSQGETTEAIASMILQHTQDSFWGIILTSAPPHCEDAPHIQVDKSDNNLQQCENLFQGILNFMKAEGILKDHRNKNSENKGKTRIYQPDEEILVKTSTAGIFLKEVKVGSYLKQGQKIGEVRDIYSGKKLEELISSEDGFLITLRQYPIVYEKEPVAIILKAKNSWREYFPWNR